MQSMRLTSEHDRPSAPFACEVETRANITTRQVPNWAAIPGRTPLGPLEGLERVDIGIFAAAAGTDARYSFSNRRLRLNISGVVIDRVSLRGLRVEAPVSTDDILMAFHHWRLLLIGEFGYNISKHEAFCRTLCLDRTQDRWTSREWLNWTYYTMARYTEERLPAMPHDPQLSLFERNAPNISEGLRLELFQSFSDRFLGRRFIISENDLVA
jgi:hypothetical protein